MKICLHGRQGSTSYVDLKLTVITLYYTTPTFNPFPNNKRQTLKSSKPKEFADDNFQFNENGRKFSKRVENIVGNGEIALYEQFLLFTLCFKKMCTTDT